MFLFVRTLRPATFNTMPEMQGLRPTLDLHVSPQARRSGSSLRETNLQLEEVRSPSGFTR